jgi:hypothetical protein
MMTDIKNYYLGNPLSRFEYMTMPLSCFPEEIIQKYNLNALALDGWVYIEIRKCMYGLNQAGTNYFKLVWHLLGTTQTGTPWDYGYTKLALSLSRLLLMISQSNTSASTMQSISETPFYEHMN